MRQCIQHHRAHLDADDRKVVLVRDGWRTVAVEQCGIVSGSTLFLSYLFLARDVCEYQRQKQGAA